MELPAWKTEQKIYEAAVKLFDSNGFDGTTVRQIAGEAGVNLALISYYFKNKKGLLEFVMIRYFEPLFQLLEGTSRQRTSTTEDLLTEMLQILIRYQSENARVTRIIQRELSVESMLAREIMSIYLTQQKHFFVSVLEEAVERGELDEALNIDLTVISLLSIAHYPYLNPQWIREVFYLEPKSSGFIDELGRQIKHIVTCLIRKK